MSTVEADSRTLTEVIAAYVAALRYEALPPEVIQHARLAILDTVGASLLGAATEEGQKVLAAVDDFEAGGQATVWGAGAKTTVPLAALINGTTAHARELDDWGGCGHSGAVVVPAVLAVAERGEVSGRDVLAATVAGYEVAARIMDGAGGYREHNKLGWHSTGTCGSFGAAAGAARAMGLDADACAAALGIAGSYTGGLWAFIADGAMTKRLHPGKAAETGVVAAYLARRGFTGPSAILEAKWGGFYGTYAPEYANPSATLAGLGAEFHILRSGFKPHASCRGIHGALDAFLVLAQQQNIKPNDVERIEVIASAHAFRQLGKQHVGSVLDAQLSIPYSLAVALLSGSTGPTQYTDERVADPEVRAWSQRISVVVDEGFSDDDPHVVRIHRHSGGPLESSVPIAKGDPRNPMSPAELENKFLETASSVMPAAKAREICQLILHLEEVDSIGRVTRMLATEGVGTDSIAK